MSTRLDNDTLRGLLLEQLGKSKVFQSEVSAYERGPDLRKYEFLIGCIDRYLSKHIMKRNRQQHTSSGSKPDSPYATPAIKGRGRGVMGGADPAGGTPKWGAEGQPCFAYQTNSCQHGDACRYKHVKISQEEYPELKKKRGEALI